MPASGKSTLATAFKEALSGDFKTLNVKISDPDLLRKKIMGGRFEPEKESIVREKALEEIRNLLEHGNVVISDDLNYYTSMRHDLKCMAEELNIPYFIFHVSTPLETCIKWNHVRGETVPDDVIRQVHDKFDHFGNYKWEKPMATVNMAEVADLHSEAKGMISKIQDILESIKHQVPSADRIVENDLSQQYKEDLDALTRTLAGEILKDIRDETLRSKIVKSRKKFLKKHLDSGLSEEEITREFKAYVERQLDF